MTKEKTTYIFATTDPDGSWKVSVDGIIKAAGRNDIRTANDWIADHVRLTQSSQDINPPIFELPVPHLYSDGSFEDLWVQRREKDSHMTIDKRQGEPAFIIVGDSAHARALAAALLIAADLTDPV